MSKIQILSDLTINQIAAGEVIENPASVVKELIENAIDAGATRVTIEILAGGYQWIKISDDGFGMSPEDAVLSLERHATSKLIHEDDLFSLTTMGFRGEALASIAAISKMSLMTALENAAATTVEVEGGKVLHTGLAARSRGTTIEVRSLFFNVPARKKFQKSASSSSAEITKVVTQLALAHPEIGIELIQQGRTLFSLPPASLGEDFFTSLRERTKALLSEEFHTSSYVFEWNEAGHAGKGLLIDPLFSRYNRSGQYLFVNHRPVSCFPIAYAIRDAYGTRLSPDRHPAFLIHLHLPPNLIDVNVHPQKKEIRLRDESQLKYALHDAVNAALGSQSQNEHFVPFRKGDFTEFSSPSLVDFSESFVLQEERSSGSELPLSLDLNIVGIHEHYLLIDAKSLPSFLFKERDRLSLGLVFANLFAAEARVQFDALMRHVEDLPITQGLLIPVTLSFTRAEVQILQANLEVMQKLGMQMRPIGDTLFLIEAIPPFLDEGEIQKTLEELIHELQGLEKERTKKEDKLRRLAARISQRVRLRKKRYSLIEARKVLEQLLASQDPHHCPQGKLTLFHIREEEIEDHFTARYSPSTTR